MRKSYNHNYKPIRLKTATYDRLIAWTMRAVAAYQRNSGPRWWKGDEPTPDEAIAELVRRSDSQRKRSKAAYDLGKERRAKGKE